MFKKSRSRWGLFALVLVLSLAFAAMTTASAVTVPAGTLSLHVANGTGLFTYTPTSGVPQTQSLVPARTQVCYREPRRRNPGQHRRLQLESPNRLVWSEPRSGSKDPHLPPEPPVAGSTRPRT